MIYLMRGFESLGGGLRYRKCNSDHTLSSVTASTMESTLSFDFSIDGWKKRSGSVSGVTGELSREEGALDDARAMNLGRGGVADDDMSIVGTDVEGVAGRWASVVLVHVNSLLANIGVM